MLAGLTGLALARRLGEQAREVEPPRDHGDALPLRGSRPLLLRPVSIELDAVSVRISEIDGLTDTVVGGAVERDAGVEDALHGSREVRAIGKAHRDVVEPGRPRRGRGAAVALPGVEADMVVVTAG